MAFGEHLKANIISLIGGTSIQQDLQLLDNGGVHVVSGTCGRINDMIQRRTLKTKNVRILVIDEADEMLQKNFKSQLYECYRYLPHDTQVFGDYHLSVHRPSMEWIVVFSPMKCEHVFDGENALIFLCCTLSLSLMNWKRVLFSHFVMDQNGQNADISSHNPMDFDFVILSFWLCFR